jgi:hypothetical protein
MGRLTGRKLDGRSTQSTAVDAVGHFATNVDVDERKCVVGVEDCRVEGKERHGFCVDVVGSKRTKDLNTYQPK